MIDTKEIASHLTQGGVVAIPTDTVYGLAADLYSTDGIAAIYQLKKRSLDKSLILFLPDIETIHRIPVKLTHKVEQFIIQFWPGDVTIILQLTEEALTNPFWKLRAAKDGSLALRIPNHSHVRDLMRKYELCLMTTSANISGQEPCQTPEEIHHQFGSEFPILDGTNGMSQVASTIVDCRDDQFTIVRKGRRSTHTEFLKFMEVDV